MAASQAFVPYGYPEVAEQNFSAPTALPLVSCIMPTRNRQAFVPQAIKYFLRQTYPNKELIIVDDSDEDNVHCLVPNVPNVKYIRLSGPTPYSIGTKRNLAIAESNGEIIVLWDDDDWYGTERIFSQVSGIIAGHCDVTAIDKTLLYHVPNKTFWAISDEVRFKMFYMGFVSGTLAFRRWFFDIGCLFSGLSVGEDSEYYRTLVANGARFQTVVNDRLFIYIRHSFNTWLFEPGQTIAPSGWATVTLPAHYMPLEDLVWYGIVKPEVMASQHQYYLDNSADWQTASGSMFLWPADPNSVPVHP